MGSIPAEGSLFSERFSSWVFGNDKCTNQSPNGTEFQAKQLRGMSLDLQENAGPSKVVG